MSEDVSASQKGTSPGLSPGHTNDFRGGVTIALLALFLLLATFSISDPLIPRTLAILLAVVGVATAASLVPVRAPQDYYGGLMLVWLAILALIASAELPGQRGFAFGPGTAPRLFAGMLALLGAAVTIVGSVSSGPPIEKYKLRGPALVLGAIILFACMIRPVGLVISAYLTWIIAISGSTEKRWIESLIAAGVMTAFCVILFVYLLNLPFQLWPQPNAPEILVKQFVEFFELILGPLFKALGVA